MNDDFYDFLDKNADAIVNSVTFDNRYSIMTKLIPGIHDITKDESTILEFMMQDPLNYVQVDLWLSVNRIQLTDNIIYIYTIQASKYRKDGKLTCQHVAKVKNKDRFDRLIKRYKLFGTI